MPKRQKDRQIDRCLGSKGDYHSMTLWRVCTYCSRTWTHLGLKALREVHRRTGISYTSIVRQPDEGGSGPRYYRSQETKIGPPTYKSRHTNDSSRPVYIVRHSPSSGVRDESCNRGLLTPDSVAVRAYFGGYTDEALKLEKPSYDARQSITQ